MGGTAPDRAVVATDEGRLVDAEAQRPSRPWVAPESDAAEHPSSSAPSPDTSRTRTTTSVVLPPAPVGPMTISDILDGSFTIIKRRPRAVIGAVAVVIVPVQVVSTWLQTLSDAPESTIEQPYDVVYSLEAQADPAITMLVVAIATLSLFFVGGIVSNFVAAWYAGRDLRAGEALRATFRRTPAFLVAWLVLFPVKVFSYLLCIAPIAVTVTFFALTAPAITMEGIGPFAGIKRSAQLVARRFWRCLGLVLLASLLEAVLQLALSAIPMIVAVFLPAPADWIVLASGEAAAALLTTTALVGASVLLYVDLRARTEGLDLELRAVDAFERAS
jgi:hypothetical protein